jgi:hypothetical protein
MDYDYEVCFLCANTEEELRNLRDTNHLKGFDVTLNKIQFKEKIGEIQTFLGDMGKLFEAGLESPYTIEEIELNLEVKAGSSIFIISGSSGIKIKMKKKVK